MPKFYSLLLFLFLLSQKKVDSDENWKNPTAKCLEDCVRNTREKFLVTKFATVDSVVVDESKSDTESEYDETPLVVKKTQKLCRILKYSETCAVDCSGLNFNPITFNVTENSTNSLPVFSHICSKETKNALNNYRENCFDEVKIDWESQCEDTCGDNWQNASDFMAKTLAEVGLFGSRDLLTEAFNRTCNLFRCWTPCQADVYKHHCEDGRKIGLFVMDLAKRTFLKIRQKTEIWKYWFWPTNCESLVTEDFQFPSEVIKLNRDPRPKYNVTESPFIHDLYVRLGYRDSAGFIGISNGFLFALSLLIRFLA